MNLKAKAIECTTLSRLMNDREKVDTDYIIEHFPEGVTLSEVDVVTTVDHDSGEIEDHYAVVTYKEEPEKFFCGGLVLTNIVDCWMTEFKTTVELSAQVAKDNIKVKLEKSKTKNNKTCTKITII